MRRSSGPTIVFGLLVAIVAVQLQIDNGFAQPRPPAPVVVTKVVEREITTGQTFVGTVMPMRTSIVGSAVDGRVQSLAVDEGDAVVMVTEIDPYDPAGEKKCQVGQPIAQLRTKTLSLEIAASKAQLDQFKSQLEELLRTLPETRKQALATLEETEALAKFAESKHSRLQSAKQGGAVTQDELDDAYSKMIVARQLHIKSQSAAMLLDQTRESKVAQAKARVLAQQATVDRLEDVKRKYTIRAPFKGSVVVMHTEVGAWVRQGDPVAEVVELDPVEIKVSVPEIYIDKLHQSLSADSANKKRTVATVTVNAVPNRKFLGEVRAIVPRADLRTRSFPVRVVIRNADQVLKPGMLARVSFAVGIKKKSLLIHKDALVLGGPSPIVYVTRLDPKTKQTQALPVPVQTGVAIDSMIEIRGQLQAGDQVVIEGNERLRPGQPVKIIPPSTKKPKS